MRKELRLSYQLLCLKLLVNRRTVSCIVLILLIKILNVYGIV